MQDRPDAAELLEAVSEFLFVNVRTWVPDERRFQVLVAANSCAIVARELRAGDAPSRADLALFTELLAPGTDAETFDPSAAGAALDVTAAAREAASALATRLRAGELDEGLETVVARLREHVGRKLDVTRPGYAISAES